MKIGSTDISNCKIGSTQINSVYIGTVKVWDYYCAELQAIIARANALGYTLPAAATLTAMNTLILAMKSGGFWAEQDLILNFAYNNALLSDFCKINWKTPADSLAILNGGLTYQTRGFLGNALDGYIDTSNNPATYGGNYTLDDAGKGLVLYQNSTDVYKYLDGNSTANKNMMRNVNSNASRINSSNKLSGNWAAITSGYKCINRDNATNIRCYNLAVESIFTQTSVAVTNGNQYIFRSGTTYTDAGISFYHLGGSISAAHTLALRNAYNTFLTTIGLTAFA